MLEGLEIREIPLSECKKNKDYRIDTDYYINIPTKNPLYSYKKIGDCLIDSLYGISIDMNEEGKGYPIYRMNEIHHMLCDLEVGKYASISQETFKKFCLCDSDVLFNRTNSYEFVGRTSIYYDNDSSHRTFASYLVKLVPNSNILLPEYLTIYLNTKQGIKDIKRHARQSINQTNVNPEEVKDMEIPILSMSLQKELKDFLIKANKKRCNSFVLYKDAEKLLLKELGFEDWQQSTDNISVKTLKDSFCSSGRIDAEYYQAFYEDCEKLLCSYKEGTKEFETICQTDETNYLPNPKKQYKYIELSNIGKYGNIVGCTECEGSELPTRARRMVKKGDVIVSSIEGSLDSCALITEDYDEALCSTGFYVVRSTFYNPETLLVLFKSKPFQMLMKKGCSGTILTAISKNEIDKIQLPLIDKSIQSRLSTFIQESFALRHESERLLEVAKKAVEIAISENEETALEYIQQNYHS